MQAWRELAGGPAFARDQLDKALTLDCGELAAQREGQPR